MKRPLGMAASLLARSLKQHPPAWNWMDWTIVNRRSPCARVPTWWDGFARAGLAAKHV